MMNKKRKIHNWVIGILLGAIAAISLFPFYWNLVSAFKPVSEIFTYQIGRASCRERVY